MITIEKKHIVIALLLIMVGVFFWSSVLFQDVFYKATAFISLYIDKSPFLAGLIFVGLAALAIIISPFSSAPLIPIVIVIWGEALTTVLLVLGWLIGGIVIYFIGRGFGAPLFSKTKVFQTIDYYRKRMPDKAEFGLVLLFRFAIPSEIAGYVLGIIRYDFIKFIMTSIIYETFFAVGLVYLSDALVYKRPFLFVLLLAVMVLIIGASVYSFRHKIKNSTSL